MCDSRRWWTGGNAEGDVWLTECEATGNSPAFVTHISEEGGRGGGEWEDCRERTAESEGGWERVYLHRELRLLPMAKNYQTILFFLPTFWAWPQLDAQARECAVQQSWSRRSRLYSEPRCCWTDYAAGMTVLPTRPAAEGPARSGVPV